MRTTLLLFAFLPSLCAADFDGFARAIHQVETGGRVGPILSDNGKALGPLCIHRVCWLDVKDKIGGKYEDCADLAYSIRVLRAYCERYERKALRENDFEPLARLFNSGPNWRNKRHLTDSYWRKVKAQMKPSKS
jgi:hypothetical protein